MPLLFDWWLADTAALLAVCLVLLYYWSTATFGYWSRLGVRSASNPKPLFGNMLPAFSQTRQFGMHFEDLYKELEGERFGGYYKMRTPTLLLRDPEVIKHVMAKDFHYFMDNDVVANEKTDPMFAYNIFNMKGIQWKYARKKFTPVFSTGKIRAMFPLIQDVCQQLKDHLKHCVNSGDSTFDARRVCANYTTDVVGSCAFGVRCDSLRDENNQFRTMGREVMAFGRLRGLLMMAVFFWPQVDFLFAILNIKLFSDRVIKFFRDLVTEAMTFREKNGIQRPDMIQLLMQVKKAEDESGDQTNKVDPETGKFHFSDDVLTAQACGFFFDGFETSSIATSMALHELAINPGMQDRLREELRSNGGELTYDLINEATYLDQILMETLRKHPPDGALMKRCTQRYRLPDSKLCLNKGDTVTIPLYAMQHDPKYWPNPDVFDPERFSAENKKNIVPCSFLAFGEGPRQCIGMRFAKTQVKAALATVILNFEVQRAPETREPVIFDPTTFILTPLGGLPLKLVPL